MKNHTFIYFFVFVLVIIASGCSGTYDHKIDFNPSEPLRIAVLPFLAVDSDGKVVEQESRLVLDNLSLVSTALEETPNQIVRKLVMAELKNSGLDLISPGLIDIDLPHHGFNKADGTIDTERLHSIAAKELCTHFLDCDAVMYGTVTHWDRSYYGIESVNTVGVDMKLVSARTGKIIFSANAEDSDSRGITKIPTGFSSIVLEPIKGLDSDIIVKLARSVTKKMLEPLDLKSRPDFLETAPPSIFASSHDQAIGTLPKNKPLIVVMFASEKQAASFSIGSTIKGIPMIERHPGHYYGEYVPLPGDSFVNAPVVVAVTDMYGRTTTQQIAKEALTLGN